MTEGEREIREVERVDALTSASDGPEIWRAALLEKRLRIGKIREGGDSYAPIVPPCAIKIKNRAGRPTKLSDAKAYAIL